MVCCRSVSKKLCAPGLAREGRRGDGAFSSRECKTSSCCWGVKEENLAEFGNISVALACNSGKPSRYVFWSSALKVASPRSMKYKTPASRAPGSSSMGMMRSEMASISVACSGVKNSSFGGLAATAASCACFEAESSAGQLAEIHAALMPVPARRRKVRRLSSLIIVDESSLNSQTLGGRWLTVKKNCQIRAIQIFHFGWHCGTGCLPHAKKLV